MWSPPNAVELVGLELITDGARRTHLPSQGLAFHSFALIHCNLHTLHWRSMIAGGMLRARRRSIDAAYQNVPRPT